MRSAIRNGYSTLGEKCSYKYDLSSTSWIYPLCNVYKCINDYVTDFIVTPDISHFIRELCICRLWRFFCSNKYRNVSIFRIYLYNIIIKLL